MVQLSGGAVIKKHDYICYGKAFDRRNVKKHWNSADMSLKWQPFLLLLYIKLYCTMLYNAHRRCYDIFIYIFNSIFKFIGPHSVTIVRAIVRGIFFFYSWQQLTFYFNCYFPVYIFVTVQKAFETWLDKQKLCIMPHSYINIYIALID